MKTTTFLYAFLLFDVFLMGAIAATAFRHAYAHLKRHEQEPEKPHTLQGGHLPPAMREHLLETAQMNFQAVLTRSATELQKDLDDTATDIKRQIEKLSHDAIRKELEHYLTTIGQLQKQTKEHLSGAEEKVTAQQAELETKLVADIANEKQRLLQQIDTKLADAITSFLLETLGHEVDLGAQNAYLLSTLEEHKIDIMKGITNEV